MECLNILDGHGYIYRAYYGMSSSASSKSLQTKDGLPTNALYTFAQMLIRLYLDEHYERLVVVFDAPGRNFRNDLDENYKKTRRETPEDLKPQLPYFQQICEVLGWPVVIHPGVEADDVIATLAMRARARDWNVRIFSGDKDLLQLVDEHITQYEPLRNILYDVAQVEKKFGVKPTQLRDYLALVGDSSDNVPGMSGVGAKTAAKLLALHGSLEDILAQKSDFKGKMKERFHDPKLLARLDLSRQLVTLKDNIELDVELDTLVMPPWDTESLDSLFNRLEFSAPLARLYRDVPELHAKSSDEPPSDVAAKDSETSAAATDHAKATDGKPAKAVKKKLLSLTIPAPIVALDDAALAPVITAAKRHRRLALALETDGKRPDRAIIIGLGVAAPEVTPIYLPLGHRYLGAPEQWSEIPAALAELCTDPEIAVVAHDVKTHRRILAQAGLPLAGIVDDTLLSTYLLDAKDEPAVERVIYDKTGLKVASRQDLTGKGRKRLLFESVSVENAGKRAGLIAGAVLALGPVLRQRLEAADLHKLFDDLELPLARLLSEIEPHGITIDIPYLRALSDELGGQIAGLENQAHELVGESFNLSSPKQLSEILFEKLELKSDRKRKTKTGNYSTNHDVLETMLEEHPVIALIMEHRELSKLKGTYLDALPPLVNPKTGRIHTSFNQAVASTGRLSSQDPNLQNIPIRKQLGRRIRRAFIAAEGKTLLSVDYSQIELRILAHLSRDPVLMRAFREGVDVHTETATEVFEIRREKVGPDERRVAKAVNYGLMYGQSAFGLARALSISRRQAAHYMDRYFERFATVEAFMKRAVHDASLAGQTVTLLGRRRPLPQLASSDHQRRKAAERMAQNAPVQGTAADIIKLAMLRVAERMKRDRWDALMLLTVHDELVFEVEPQQAEAFAAAVVEEMESAYQLDVPLKAEVGIATNWADAH